MVVLGGEVVSYERGSPVHMFNVCRVSSLIHVLFERCIHRLQELRSLF